MELWSRFAKKAQTVVVSAGEISQPYTILGRIDVSAEGADYTVAYYWQYSGVGFGNVTRYEHKENPVGMNEMLKFKALETYGDQVDAIINVHYETMPRNDVFAGGVAVHFAAQKTSGESKSSGAVRLKELQNLRDQQLITPEEYERKRKEILKEL